MTFMALEIEKSPGREKGLASPEKPFKALLPKGKEQDF